MEALSALLSSLSNIVAPILDAIVWLWPLKWVLVHDGEGAVILTCGKVRGWRKAERGPGISFYGPCESVRRVQTKGGWIDTCEQGLRTKDGDVLLANGAIIYHVASVRSFALCVEKPEDQIGGVVQDELRRWAQDTATDDVCDTDKITARLVTRCNKRIAHTGCVIDEILLTDLRPHNVQLAVDGAYEATELLADALDKAGLLRSETR